MALNLKTASSSQQYISHIIHQLITLLQGFIL